MAKVSPLVVLPPVIMAGLFALFWFGMNRQDPDALPSALVGRDVPAVKLTQLGDDPPFTDADLRDGRPKLVNYWASWCAPCRAEAPTLDKMAAEGVLIYGVNYKDKHDDALKFLAETGSPYARVGADESGRMAINWGLYGVPETFVIDGKGRVVLRFPGPIDERVMRETILPALKQAAGG